MSANWSCPSSQRGWSLAQAAQGSGGDAIPGGISKRCRWGTWGHGSVLASAVWGSQFDTMTLQLFPNLNNPLIPEPAAMYTHIKRRGRLSSQVSSCHKGTLRRHHVPECSAKSAGIAQPWLGPLQKSHSLVLSPEQTLVFLLHLQQPVFQQFYLSLWQVALGLLQDEKNSSAKQCCV